VLSESTAVRIDNYLSTDQNGIIEALTSADVMTFADKG
jgi:hypothetical protein